MFCSQCGKQVNEGAAFCTSCGKQIYTIPELTHGASSPQISDSDPNAAVPKHSMRRLPLAMGSVILVILLGALLRYPLWLSIPLGLLAGTTTFLYLR